ncbi:MAG TPA: hypothetical protein VH988_22635 [Thermoanaerobaculia bacterium]|nr:hypothetical protein [Thermoanaerobaculia bacterium]
MSERRAQHDQAENGSNRPPDSSQPASSAASPVQVTSTDELSSLEPTTREQYEEALRGYYTYRIEGYHHRQKVLEWQLEASKIIFTVVLLVVLAGVYFAAVQFHVGLNHRTKELATTEIDASLKGIRISSHVLGVIILALSLAFFYCYLTYVYPVTETF